LWSDGRKFTVVAQCRTDIVVMQLTSNECRQFIEGSEKAKLQWKLEEQFRDFEGQW
jgi:adenosine deaminase